MPGYRRAWYPGGTNFFTVNLLRRSGNNDLLVRRVRLAHPSTIHGWAVLHDHPHGVSERPAGATDFALRWRLIKAGFAGALPATECRSAVRQRRYWEHLIRNEADFAAPVDYVRINPVKHGLVARVLEWPFSTFHRLVRERGVGRGAWRRTMWLGRNGQARLHSAQHASLLRLTVVTPWCEAAQTRPSR